MGENNSIITMVLLNDDKGSVANEQDIKKKHRKKYM